MMELYSSKVVLSVSSEVAKAGEASLSYLSGKKKDFLSYLIKRHIKAFKPIELAKPLTVSPRMIASWSLAPAKNGFLRPNLVEKRIASYSLTDFATEAFWLFLKITGGTAMIELVKPRSEDLSFR